jgi:hypothetical protein
MTKGPRKADVRDVGGRVDEMTDLENDNAVCAVLRWAVRTKAGPSAALSVCQTVGVDLVAALRRARRWST